MARRFSIYLNDAQDKLYKQIQTEAEAEGITAIDFLLRRDTELRRLVQKLRNTNRKKLEGFEAFTLSLGDAAFNDKA